MDVTVQLRGAATSTTEGPIQQKRARQDSCDEAVLRRLSQDLFPTVQRAGSAIGGSGGCDSSDCLLCGGGLYHGGPFCSQAVSQRICTWLGRRLSDAAALQTADAVAAAAAAVGGSDSCPVATSGVDPLKSKRVKRSDSGDGDSSSSWPLCSTPEEPSAPSRCLPAAWKWREEFAAREDPAPCSMAQLAEFRPPTRTECSSSPHHCDLVCGLEFSLDGRLLVAAGVSKQLRLYTLESLLDPSLLPQQLPVAVVRTFAKVSSLAWNPDSDGVVTLGDYDGVLTQVHVCSGHIVTELEDAHGGRRVWSVRHSPLRRHLCLSASEDKTARVWSGAGLDTCAATIRPPCASTVCCADFSGSHEHLVSLACSSHKAYIYDLRATSQPLVVLQGHTRPVSYARFFGADKLVSASTDGTLAAWDLAAALELEQQQHQQVVLPPQGSRQCSPILQQQHGEDEDIMEATAGRRRQAKPASTPFANSSGSTATHAALSGSCSSQQPDAPALTAAAAAGAVGWRSSSPVATGSSCSSVVPASRCWGSGSMAVVTPWKSFRGHTNAKNFVGLSVRPEDGLLACGSETSEVFTYHTSWDKPLATFGLDSSSCASNGSSSSCSMGGAPAAAAGAMGPAGVAPFVSAVAWQSWQASHSLGLPAVLAAASSMGTIKILSLVEA